MTERSGRTRREFVREAGAAGAVAAGALSNPARALAVVRPSRRQTVAVFGGGIAGLTAAHELAERGFDVTIYERRAWGGKARSIDVPNSASSGRKALPGEHGYRVVFGQYSNLPETLSRIPYGSNPNGVFDNLVPGPQVSLARDGGRDDLVLPIGARDPSPYTAAQVLELLRGVLLHTHLTPDEAAYFVQRIGVFMSSCDARRFGEWEAASWWDFAGAEGRSEDYRELFAVPWTRLLQALRPEHASARAICRILELIIYGELGFGMTGPFIRVTNAQTSEAWIDPWISHLDELGVNLRLGHSLTGFGLRNGFVSGARVQTPRGRRTVHADWYVCALPIERAKRMWSGAMRRAAPALERAARLETRWMNGIQFFLREPTPIVKGPVGYVNSPWALSSVSKAQFWPDRDFAATYGDGRVGDCLSVDISDWTQPGILYGKPAHECTPDQVAREVWAQMKAHLNDSGSTKLADDSIVSWFLDPGLVRHGDRIVDSEDPLIVPTPGSWHDRPAAGTAIPNFLLAADYVLTDFEAQTMEAANEAGRRAANALIDRSGSHASPCEVYTTYQPPEWEPFKRIDEQRYRSGQPNLFDDPPATSELRALLGSV